MKRRETPYLKLLSSISSLRLKVSEGNSPNVIFIYGENEYLNFKVLKLIKDIFSSQTYAIQSMDPIGLNEETVNQLWEQQDLFHCKTLYSSESINRNQSIASYLLGAAQRAPSNNTFCLVFKSKSLPTKLKKDINSDDLFSISVGEPYQSELTNYIRNEGLRYRLRFDSDACRTLITSQGSNLLKLDNEISKLSLLLVNSDKESKQSVSSASVEKYCYSQRLDHLFELDNLLLQKNYPMAIEHSAKLIKSGEALISIITVISGHCRKTLRVKSVLAESARSISNAAQIPPWLVPRYQAYAQTMQTKTLERVLLTCQLIDSNMKSSSIATEVLASEAIMEFVQ